jgi:hypothetical protein
MEERSFLRRQTSEITNSLSVSDRVRTIPWDLSLAVADGILETLGFESESPLIS